MLLVEFAAWQTVTKTVILSCKFSQKNKNLQGEIAWQSVTPACDLVTQNPVHDPLTSFLPVHLIGESPDLLVAFVNAPYNSVPSLSPTPDRIRAR
jgi:hypothetical protein